MNHDSNCHVELIHKPFDEKDVASISKARLSVSGMGCPNCVIRVRNAILQLDGVNWVDADLETGVIQVAYNAERISPAQFMPAVTAAGNDGRHNYRATLIA